MSVLLSKRKESRYEAIVYADEIHDMLVVFMKSGFGVKDLEHYVRIKYAYGDDSTEDLEKYRYLMQNSKKRIEQFASLIIANLRAAYSSYPTSMHEYEKRRDYQNAALVNCQCLLKELEKIVEKFNVDINLYKPYIKAIEREIVLIKRWRQRDNKFKTFFEKQGNV
jgi:hypothetical protein